MPFSPGFAYFKHMYVHTYVLYITSFSGQHTLCVFLCVYMRVYLFYFIRVFMGEKF